MGTILKCSNRGGIPCLKSTSAVMDSLTDTLTVIFPQYSNFPKNYSGVAILNIQPSFTATGLTTINLVINGSTVTLKTQTGSNAGATQITGAGLYPVFIDHGVQTISLLTS